MKVLSVCILFVFAFVAAKTETSNLRTTTIIDLIEAGISQEDWSEDPACYADLLSTLHSARNFTLWATWVIFNSVMDSMHFPRGVLYGSRYQLGNYDQCVQAPGHIGARSVRTKYCLADVRLVDDEPEKGPVDPDGSAEKYIRTRTKHDRNFTMITWGVCVPSSCSFDGVSKFVRVMLKQSHFQPLAENARVDVNECDRGEEGNYEGVYFFLLLLLGLLITALSCTYYVAKKGEELPDTLVSQVAKSFCMRKNGLSLVKYSADDLQSVHGIRVLSQLIFVLTHHIYFAITGHVENGLGAERFLDQILVFRHTDLITDTFLMLSGMLLARGLVDKWDKPENPLAALWKRYLRLLPTMALIVFYMSSVSIHTGSGPMWRRFAGTEAAVCQKNGWLTLLMLNNYINSDEICFLVLWYVPADFQLTILGVILFFIYRYYPRIGAIVIGGVTLAGLIAPGVVTYWYRLPATIVYSIRAMENMRADAVFTSTYIQSHHRAPAYLAGMAFGCFLAKYNPARYRHAISKRVSIPLFIAVFAVNLANMLLGGVFYTRAYDVTEVVTYAILNRGLFAIGIVAMIVLCEYGNVPLVTGLLSWKAFVPLSRLSYGAYLTHAAILQRNMYSQRLPATVDFFMALTESMGVAVIAFLFSLVLWLLVQAPVTGIINALSRSRKAESNQKFKEISTKESITNGHKKLL